MQIVKNEKFNVLNFLFQEFETNKNEVRIEKLINKNKIKKNEDLRKQLKNIEKKFIRMDDDYANTSMFLYNLSRECEDEYINLIQKLDEIELNTQKIIDENI